MKNVLVIYFSQSGQLHEIAQNISGPLLADPNVNLLATFDTTNKPLDKGAVIPK